MWHVFQGLIIFAVVASNIHWQWTPNGMLAALLGVGLAFLLTVSLSRLANLLRQDRVSGD
jgi:uncharacterized membrane protein YgaE (UPF0421/DUF939 family)